MSYPILRSLSPESVLKCESLKATFPTEVEMNWTNTKNFITKENMDKLCTKASTTPVFVGSNEAYGPFMIIRFIDSQHNKKMEIQEDAKSFVTVYLAPAPHVGVELMATVYRFIVDNGKVAGVKCEEMFYLDGGETVAKWVGDLLCGNFSGMIVK